MRDPNRLNNFYDTMKNIHKKSFPDWRFGQFMFNFTRWLYIAKEVDIFYPEEDKMIFYLKEFANAHS